jgi:hypothetical protein
MLQEIFHFEGFLLALRGNGQAEQAIIPLAARNVNHRLQPNIFIPDQGIHGPPPKERRRARDGSAEQPHASGFRHYIILR